MQSAGDRVKKKRPPGMTVRIPKPRRPRLTAADRAAIRSKHCTCPCHIGALADNEYCSICLDPNLCKGAPPDDRAR